MHGIKDEANKISDLIELSKRKHKYRHLDKKAIYADNDWAAGHFLAKLFSISQFVPYTYISLEELNIFFKEFEAIEGVFDSNGLLDRSWIRIIGGIVEIPSAISNAVRQLEKIKDAETEFNFILKAVEEFRPNRTILKAEFLRFVSNYQEHQGVAVSFEKCKSFNFIVDHSDKISISNPEYIKPIFEYKKELAFIKFLLKKTEEGDRDKLKINKEEFISIHASHKLFFPETPSIDDLIIQKVIIEEGNCFYLNPGGTDPDYWVALGGKVGQLLYSSIKKSGRYNVETDLVRAWLLKMRFIDDIITSPKFMKTEEVNHLLHCCLEMLLNEKDILGADTEIEKLVLSKWGSQYVILANSEKIGFPKLTDAKNIFELFNLMEECNEAYHADLLWKQQSREFVNKLIQLVVLYDNEKGADGIEYPLIRRSLLEGLNRPYLLWKTSFFIYYWRPEIIPYLLMDGKIASLAFNLYFLSETNETLSVSETAEIRRSILCKCFDLLLSALTNLQGEFNLSKAQTVFECLITISEHKWQQYRNEPTTKVLSKRYNFQRDFDEIIEVLKCKKLPGSYFDAGGKTDRYFFPEITSELFTCIKKYNPQKIHTEKVVGLPLVKMEFFSLLLRVISDKGYLEIRAEDVLQEQTLVNQFLSDYLNVMNLETINIKTYLDSEQKDDSVPIWPSNQGGLEVIPWEKWTLYFERNSILPDFLKPVKLKLKRTEDKWEKSNHFNVTKIRKHIKILILIHQRLRVDESKYKEQGFKTSSAISRIEQAIADFVSLYSVNDTLNGRIDVFGEQYERSVYGSFENALIPKLAQALNKFDTTKKQEILKSLTKADSFTKCLKLLEFLSSESDRDFMRKQIEDFNVEQYLSEKRYIPEIETVLVKLSEFEEFIDKAKQALEYWNKRVLGQRNGTEYQIIYFRIKLLIAYYEGDEQSILIENAPPVDSFSTSNGYEFDPVETRNFYLALVKLKNNDPESAYNIFSQLIKSSKISEPAIAINRFYSHINLAETKSSKEEVDKCLSDALMEWDTFEVSIPEKSRRETLNFVQENIWLNKLSVFHKLCRFDDFERLFSSLDKTYQLRQDFFEARINNYIERKQYELAKLFLKEAKTYHQSNDDSLPEFIKHTREKLENEEDYRRLRKEYLDLITRSPEKLIYILPGNIVGNRNLPEYILKEICNSVNDILDTVNSVEAIDKEDKYTDLLILSLKSRFRYWSWEIGNARGGFSAGNKRNNGELDFVINSADKERIATCEALVLHGKNSNVVTSHVIKSFNYDHRRTLFFILAYYNGSDFSNHWEDYRKNIIPNIVYPVGFPVVENIEEVRDTFTNSCVKVLLVNHGSNAKVYHVFLNVNYKINF